MRITNEPCPVCGMPATCEHGTIVNDRPAHIWNCRACDEHIGILGYDCADCARVQAADRAEASHANNA